jgi:hypothetical protein
LSGVLSSVALAKEEAQAKAEVLADGDKFSIIRKRESYEDLISLEK